MYVVRDRQADLVELRTVLYAAWKLLSRNALCSHVGLFHSADRVENGAWFKSARPPTHFSSRVTCFLQSRSGANHFSASLHCSS